MARNRIVLKRIAKDSTRRTTFKKRCRGVVKKASELASLCGIGVCAVVYGEGEAKPEAVWPSVPEVRSILSRFRAAPDVDRFKRVTNQEDYLRKRIARLRDRMRASDEEIRERDSTVMIYEAYTGRRPIAALTVEELANVGLVMDDRIKTLEERYQRLRGEPIIQTTQPPAMLPVAPSRLVSYGNGGMESNASVFAAPPQKQGRFMNMAGGHVGTSFCGGFGSGGSTGASTSAGVANHGAGFSWAAPPGTRVFPPM
ncbi:hypothetical protein GUJ93_ZPchr0001g33124 [Zizania palustris]|uniref:MADS-box domain-containing protein n=1 Tax=Zizania palustris TaxID=103762 RepID=A0A8J5RRP6_ZIZPA|nr:hypothetical protein GUJ93_ZPchr0001g30920 [Zizania palustris]KAG8051961.1 hypothetical protein GUJ93_ZPchr0001g33124 [Zizania palustris]